MHSAHSPPAYSQCAELCDKRLVCTAVGPAAGSQAARVMRAAAFPTACIADSQRGLLLLPLCTALSLGHDYISFAELKLQLTSTSRFNLISRQWPSFNWMKTKIHPAFAHSRAECFSFAFWSRFYLNSDTARL
jgi:hypothetical protein